MIRRYYENREQIDGGRLSELVTSLYLAESTKKQDQLWASVEKLLARLETAPTRLAHILETRDVTALAELVQDLQKE